MKKAMALAAIGLATATMTLMHSDAGGVKRSDAVVKVKAKLDKAPTGKAVVVVSLDIQPGWYLYANPVGNEQFESSRVIVKVAGVDAAVEYPPGKTVIDKDPRIGQYKIYENKIEIRAAVDRAPTETSPLEVSVRLQSCDKGNCLAPATVKLTVP